MFKVLSIDGGGIRGVIPARILVEVEERAGKPMADMCDLFIGTSTGGIIAAGLTAPGNKKAKPKFSAADMLALYVDRGHEIFHRSLWDGVTNIGGLTDELYDEAPLEKLLKKYLGNTTLRDCLKPVVITAYDIERREPYLFKTRRALEEDERNHYMRDAARATSAAPTYFEPEVVKSLSKPAVSRALVDGGVYLNNPSLAGYFEAISMGQKHDDLLVASFGTGIATRKIPFEDARDWGKLGWVQPIISVMMDGQADSADHHLGLTLSSSGADQRYFRFDKELRDGLDDMDAANRSNILGLLSEAEAIIDRQGAEIDKLVEQLLK
ncbi:MAG: patatin-like phospholipase family protein [Minwuia sp.]|uniref:patatin-like phospholipase family protein n=1 Tax=Minwuia sp. TaxID=2493630 RepID=UPI003A881AF2